MRFLLLSAVIFTFALLFVMANVFRNQRAVSMLRSLQKLMWVWILVIVALAVIRVWRQGGLLP